MNYHEHVNAGMYMFAFAVWLKNYASVYACMFMYLSIPVMHHVKLLIFSIDLSLFMFMELFSRVWCVGRVLLVGLRDGDVTPILAYAPNHLILLEVGWGS